MSVFLNNGVVLTVGGVNLSDHVNSVSISRSFDELEVTAMGDGGHRFIKGLEASSITIDFFSDNADGEVNQTLRQAWGTNAVITVKQTSAATSAANPLYTMTCLINNTTDVNGAVADLAMQSLTFNVSGEILVTVA